MRISVVGSSGAGKSTFAATAAARLGLRHIELDAIYHQADWTPLPDDEFQARVRAATEGDDWAVDGNYSIVRPIVLARATHVVWLDPTRARVMRQVIGRSASRAATRAELWNGNRERITHWIDADHPIRWAWSQHDRKRREYAERFGSPEYAHLEVVRLRTPAAVRAWLDDAEELRSGRAAADERGPRRGASSIG